MNTKNLKAYAPKARSQFIEAIKKRAAQFGIYQDKIADIQFEGGAAIIEGRAFTKKQAEQRNGLERKIEEKSLATHKERYDLFIREMAYTWFNRLAAIRYMELHDYLDHGLRVLSNPNNPDSLPEILDHASDVVDILDPDQKYLDKSHIIELQLAGNKEEELYRELLLGQCHRLYNIMPFMFEVIDDATELLLPDNLTKTDSILKGLVNEIPEEDWREIEVIGWLYQFYISEHKNAVIGKVVKSEDIPAATQLFTPNWIVKYLVQNSLGKQWLATYPESELKEKMEYYIEPAEQSDDVIEQLKAITPTSIEPEQIKVLDPAVGSGHILVEVYEVLREIYLERGYRLREIPELILTKNIYGLDIDDRAAQLASFALMMKAREDDRRIFERGYIQLNVFSLQSTEGLDASKLWQALNLEGNQKQGSSGDLFSSSTECLELVEGPTGIYRDYFDLLQSLKLAFLQAKTLGSLIEIDNKQLRNLVALKDQLQAKINSSDPSAKQAVSELLPIVNQAILLSQKYDAVIANPPYMGNKSINSDLKLFLSKHYSEGKSDLMTSFILKGMKLIKKNGNFSCLSLDSWMFLTSYSMLRKLMIDGGNIDSLVHVGWNCFPEGHLYNRGVAFIYNNQKFDLKSKYIDLSNVPASVDKNMLFEQRLNNHNDTYLKKTSDYKVIPGQPLAYWIPFKLLNLFKNSEYISNTYKARRGLETGNNEKYIRHWYELDSNTISIFNSKEPSYVPYHKGGEARKWYPSSTLCVNWKNNGVNIKSGTGTANGEDVYFKQGITWSGLTSGLSSFRYSPSGFIFDSNKGPMMFPDENDIYKLLAFLNSSVCDFILNLLNPTLSIQNGDIDKLPLIKELPIELIDKAKRCVDIVKNDWLHWELSWDFIKPLNINDNSKYIGKSIATKIYSQHAELILLEDDIDSLVIQQIGIEDKGIFSSTKKRVNSLKSTNSIDNLNPDNKELVHSGYINSLISYSVGCMMGRYSLDREGLVYANSGNEGFKELFADSAYKTFPADDDGIVPLASEDWLFGDDATARFREFVKTIWGDEHLQENLEFVAESLCLHALKPKKGESANDTVRRYFSKLFYKDHCKTYKKRPIYWLFSSGKEKAFECLVYLHRYNEGSLSRMRTEYVTPLMGKYEAQHSLLAEQKIEATTTEARRIEKELKSLDKKQSELRTFDEQLKHYAEMRISLDLDDGVKANYGKFGNLLSDVKAIHGKAVK